MKKISYERVARAARIYASCKDASAALGIAPGSFTRMCRQYGIETPYMRQHKRRAVKTKRAEQEVEGQNIVAMEE